MASAYKARRPWQHAGDGRPTNRGFSILSPQTGKGIIDGMYDVDAFRFTSAGGQFQITVNAATYGPNLIPIAELWSANGLSPGPTPVA